MIDINKFKKLADEIISNVEDELRTSEQKAEELIRDKHIWEGWTVGDFIDYIDVTFNMVNYLNRRPWTNKAELKQWVKDSQPYYKKHIPEVYNYFLKKSGL